MARLERKSTAYQSFEHEDDSARQTLPPGWERLYDDESGEYYFYNQDTGESSWERPS